jgi:hypothetical protein
MEFITSLVFSVFAFVGLVFYFFAFGKIFEFASRRGDLWLNVAVAAFIGITLALIGFMFEHTLGGK